jgi:hypothetical protein
MTCEKTTLETRETCGRVSMPPAGIPVAHTGMASTETDQKRLQEIHKSPHERVRSIALSADQHSLRRALIVVGWQGPIHGHWPPKRKNALKLSASTVNAQKAAHLKLVEDTWSSIVQGLNRWWEFSPSDFEIRVPIAINLYKAQMVQQREYFESCKWGQCDRCHKWRRCLPAYHHTLERPRWSCIAANRECDEEEDALEEGETWDGQIS